MASEARKVRWGDAGAGILLALLGVGVCAAGLRLRVGSALDPQPGFFPFLGGLLLAGLAALLTVQGLRGGGPPAPVERGGLGAPALLVLGFVVYAGLLERVGYPVMTSLMALLALRVLGARWAPGIAASVLLSLGSYALFVTLGVPLPPGWLFGG